MQSIRTRIIRITTAAAFALTLGAAFSGPAAASEPSKPGSAPIEAIDTGTAARSLEGADTMASCTTRCWVYTGRRFASEEACYQAGRALLSSNRSYDDFMCWQNGSYWELWAHKR